MRVGFCCGAFDLLHPGHVLMLADAKAQCDKLIVGLQSNPHIDRPEKNHPIQTIEERGIILRAIRYVDEVVLYSTEKDLLEWLEVLQPDVRILGTDWKDRPYTGEHLGISIHWHERDHSWSTSSLRRRVGDKEKNRTPLVYGDPGLFERMFTRGDLIFDVGACMGQMTEWYLSRGARVVAVEPESIDIAVLEEKFGASPHVTIVTQAVGERVGKKHLYLHAGARTISTFVPKVWWGRNSAFYGTEGTSWEEVSMTTLDELIKQYGRPQFIKLDIEGYESQALRGLTQPVPFLQFEICVSTVKSGHVKACFDRILEISPRARFNFTLDESPTFERGENNRWHWMTSEETLAAIVEEMKRWPLLWGNGFANMTEDCNAS